MSHGQWRSPERPLAPQLSGEHPHGARLWGGELLVSAKEGSPPGLAGLAGAGMGSRGCILLSVRTFHVI